MDDYSDHWVRSPAQIANDKAEEAQQSASAEVQAVQSDLNAYKTSADTTFATKATVNDMQTTLDTQWSNQNALNETLATKVDVKSDIDGLTSTVQTNYTNLQGQIDKNVSTWQYDGVPTLTNEPTSEWTDDSTKNQHLGDIYYDTSTGRAYRFWLNGTTYEWYMLEDSDITKALASITKLEQTDDEIKASVSQEVADRSNAIATEVTNRNAAIDVKANAITSSVAETYTTKSDFDALQVGGTNLALRSNVEKNNNSYRSGYYYITPREGEALSNGYGYLVSGKTYTVTLDVTPAQGVTSFSLYLSSGQKPSLCTFNTDGTTNRQIITGKLIAAYLDGRYPADNVWNALVEIYRYPNDGTVTTNSVIHRVKIERGNKATDWSPAPEDMLSTADAATTYATQSSLTQQADRITAEVTARQTTDSNVSTLSSKVTQTQTDVTTLFTDTQTAQSTADGAVSAASAAQSTANSASTAASTADGKAVAAQSTATDAQTRVATQATLIRESSDGVDVGKAVSGAYPEGTPVARAGSDGAFHIMKKLLGVLTSVASFGENLIELGKNSTSAVIKFCAGTGEIGVIDSMLTLFADKVGVKGNSQAVLASNGESNVAAGKTNTTYTGLSQTAATAPSTDADPATALLQAKCTKNSDSSTVSETYISLTAKPDGTAPATVKASDITVLSSRETNPYIAVKNDADTIYTVPAGCTIALTTRDSYGRPSDGGIGFDGTNVSLCGANIVVNGETYSMPRFMTAIQPAVLYASTATGTAAGGTGTINLTETIEHFETVEVTFGRDGKFQTQKLDLNNGRRTLSLFLAYSPSTIHRTGIVNLTFSGTTATLSDGFFSDDGGVWTALDTIFSIYRITGRR